MNEIWGPVVGALGFTAAAETGRPEPACQIPGR